MRNSICLIAMLACSAAQAADFDPRRLTDWSGLTGGAAVDARPVKTVTAPAFEACPTADLVLWLTDGKKRPVSPAALRALRRYCLKLASLSEDECRGLIGTQLQCNSEGFYDGSFVGVNRGLQIDHATEALPVIKMQRRYERGGR